MGDNYEALAEIVQEFNGSCTFLPCRLYLNHETQSQAWTEGIITGLSIARRRLVVSATHSRTVHDDVGAPIHRVVRYWRRLFFARFPDHSSSLRDRVSPWNAVEIHFDGNWTVLSSLFPPLARGLLDAGAAERARLRVKIQAARETNFRNVVRIIPIPALIVMSDGSEGEENGESDGEDGEDGDGEDGENVASGDEELGDEELGDEEEGARSPDGGWQTRCGRCRRNKPKTQSCRLNDGCVVCKKCFAEYFTDAVQKHAFDNAPPVCPCDLSVAKVHTNPTVMDALQFDRLNDDFLKATMALQMESMLEVSAALANSSSSSASASASASAWTCSRCNKVAVRHVGERMVLACNECQHLTCTGCKSRVVSADHAAVHERVCIIDQTRLDERFEYATAAWNRIVGKNGKDTLMSEKDVTSVARYLSICVAIRAASQWLPMRDPPKVFPAAFEQYLGEKVGAHGMSSQMIVVAYRVGRLLHSFLASDVSFLAKLDVLSSMRAPLTFNGITDPFKLCYSVYLHRIHYVYSET